MRAEKKLEDPATPKPGDFPLGSPESRAAARSVLEAEETELPVAVYVSILGDKKLVTPIFRKRRD
jgi:hypothetical protein